MTMRDVRSRTPTPVLANAVSVVVTDMNMP